MDILDIEKQIIDLLKQENIEAKKYFTELAKPEVYVYPAHAEPMVLVDYIKSQVVDTSLDKYKINFELYFTHICYVNTQEERIVKHNELYTLLEDVRKLLATKSFNNSEPIRIEKIEKIYDDIANTGYLTIYKMNFSFILNDI